MRTTHHLWISEFSLVKGCDAPYVAYQFVWLLRHSSYSLNVNIIIPTDCVTILLDFNIFKESDIFLKLQTFLAHGAHCVAIFIIQI